MTNPDIFELDTTDVNHQTTTTVQPDSLEGGAERLADVGSDIATGTFAVAAVAFIAIGLKSRFRSKGKI